MLEPILTPPSETVSEVTSFGGIDRAPDCPENCFAFTENTSTSNYPNLGVRGRRVILSHLAKPLSALHTVNGITYVSGTSLIHNGVTQFDNLDPNSKKQIVSMGSKTIVFPDGYYIDTLSADTEGVCLKRGYVTTKTAYEMPAFINVYPCDSRGLIPFVSDDEPDPNQDSLWLDTSVFPNVLKEYSPDYGKWFTLDADHTLIQLDGVQHYLIQGKLTDVKGISSEVDGISTVTSVSENQFVINKRVDSFSSFALEDGPAITFTGILPHLDFVCEHQNRLFGCRYGLNQYGEFVNEIYASKLGDPGEWFCYQGLSTDSYAASCGSEGPFTGIISHLGYVVFFKENRIHRLFGTKPSNYTLYEDIFPGVAKGSEGSLCLHSGSLYYLGRDGVYAYSGSSPSLISRPLGNTPMTEGVGGVCNNKYRLSFKAQDGSCHTYAFDLIYNLWHREDGARFIFLSPIEGNLLGVKADSERYTLELLENSPVPPLCDVIYCQSKELEKNLNWCAESGFLGYHTHKCKFLSKLRLRVDTSENASVTLFYKADSAEDWVEAGSISGKKAGSYTLRFVPPRCDRIKLLIKGVGDCKVLSLTKTFENAGEVM